MLRIRDGSSSLRHTLLSPSRVGVIDPTFTPHLDRRLRRYQRRRLAVLAGVLGVTLAVGAVVTGGSGEARVMADSVVGTEAGDAVTFTELIEDTASSIVESTSSTTTSTTVLTAPTTTVAESEPHVHHAAVEVAEPDFDDEVESEPVVVRRQAPRPTTTTTTAAPTTTAPAAQSGEYAYDDPRSTQVWYDLADCEAAGNWAANTGNGYYGGLQFSLGSWESVGGSGYPHQHSASTQIEMGRRLQARAGWGAWGSCAERLGLT